MDYTNRPVTNQKPNPHDLVQLAADLRPWPFDDHDDNDDQEHGRGRR